jgi:hypothetical protein
VALNTFGVVATRAITASGELAVDSKIGHLTLSPNSNPSEQDVTESIKDAAAELNLALGVFGVNVSALTQSSDEELWHTCRSKLCFKMAGEVHAANQHGNTALAERYEAAWNGFIARLMERPGQYLGAAHNRQPSSLTSGDIDKRVRPEWRRNDEL